MRKKKKIREIIRINNSKYLVETETKKDDWKEVEGKWDLDGKKIKR